MEETQITKWHHTVGSTLMSHWWPFLFSWAQPACNWWKIWTIERHFSHYKGGGHHSKLCALFIFALHDFPACRFVTDTLIPVSLRLAFKQGLGLSLSGASRWEYSNVTCYEGRVMDGPGCGLGRTPQLGRLAWWSPSIRGSTRGLGWGCAMMWTACGRATGGLSGVRVCPVHQSSPPRLHSYHPSRWPEPRYATDFC